MKILVNGLMLSGRKTGIGWYGHRLLESMMTVAPQHEYLCLTARDSNLAEDFAHTQLECVETSCVMGRPFRRKCWELLRLPRLVRQIKPEVYFSPSFVLPPFMAGIPTVVTVHDLSWLLFPWTKSMQFRTYLRVMVPCSIRRADAVLTVSEHTKADLIKHLDASADAVQVVRLAADPAFAPAEEVAVQQVTNRLGIQRPYLLAIGDKDPRKNIRRLLEAYQTLRTADHARCSMVVVNQSTEMHQLCAQNGLDEGVVWTDYVSTDELKALYTGADVFVYPSLYEGFGMPPLEAMACNTAVVAARSSAIPEVVGDAARLIDPYNVGELTEALRDMVNNDAARDNLRARGRRHVKQFSWDLTARETLRVLESVVRRQPS